MILVCSRRALGILQHTTDYNLKPGTINLLPAFKLLRTVTKSIQAHHTHVNIIDETLQGLTMNCVNSMNETIEGLNNRWSVMNHNIQDLNN